MTAKIHKNIQLLRFSLYGFLKNLRFFEPFFLAYLLSKGLEYFSIGILYAVREIAINLFEIPSGLIADWLGRKKTLAASFVLYILSFLVFYLADGFYILLVAMLLFALSDSIRSGIHKAMIFAYLKQQGLEEQKVAYYGYTRSWSQTGTAFSSLIAGFIVYWSGDLSVVFLLAIIPYTIDLVNVMSYPAYLDQSSQMKTGETRRYLVKTFTKALKKRLFLKTLFNLSVYTGYYKAVKDYIQPLLILALASVPIWENNEQNDRTAILLGLFYFVAYLLTAAASRQSDRFAKLYRDRTTAMNISLLIGFVAGVLSGILFDNNWAWAGSLVFILLLIIENLRKPIGISMISDQNQEEIQASILSVESQAKSVIAAALALIIGLLADSFGVDMALLAVSVGLVLFSPLYWLKN